MLYLSITIKNGKEHLYGNNKKNLHKIIDSTMSFLP